MSAVTQFINLAWSNAASHRGWTIFNQHVRQAVFIAVEGFEWKPGDLEAILALRNRRYGITKCLGERWDEWIHAAGVRTGNDSFVQEFERHFGWTPLIVDRANGRDRDRLCLNSRFVWNGELVKVTSISSDSAIACSYSDDGKIRKRYTITRESILAERKQRKETSDERPKRKRRSSVAG